MAGHLSNQTQYGHQRPYVRLNGYGDMLPGSIVFREFPPKNGIWRELGSINKCCGGTNDSYIIFQNNTAAANITAIASTDGYINWRGSLANGGTILFVIPGGIDETFTVTTSAFSGRTITTSVAQTVNSEGTITTGGALSSVVNSYSTSATPASTYLVVLS